MEKKDIKKAYSDAEKELRDKQIEEVKHIVKATLEKIGSLKDRKKEIESEMKILRMDLDDLKEGRLDRIEERQKKDKKAEETSVVKIVKEIEHHHHYDRWYEPYKIYWYNQPSITLGIDTNTFTDDYITYGGAAVGGNFTGSGGNVVYTNATCDTEWMTINCSIAKNNAIGSYSVGDNVINFR